jgi:hypothetical protein
LSKHFKKILLSILFIFCIQAGYGLSIKDDSLRFEILLSSKMLNDTLSEEKFVNSIDITSNRLILLSTTNQYYLLGWGGIGPLGQKVTGNIGSFAFTSDSLLMTIRNNELCGFESDVNLSKLFDLPNEGMGISSGKYVMYIYDRDIEKTKYALYVIAKGGNYYKLFEVPSPIKSVVEMNSSILFATGNGLFSFNLKDKNLKALAVLPKDEEIKSIAVDTSSNRIYFSTENVIYALVDSKAAIVFDDFGGILRFFDNGLMVFNPDKKFLIRIIGIEDRLKLQPTFPAAYTKPTSGLLTNSTIINLVKTKISDDLIINLINSSPVNFNTSVDSMIYLSGQNVSSQVILAMRNAMKMKSKPINSTDGTDTGNKIITNNQAVQNLTTSVAESTPTNRFYIITGSYPTEQQANEAVSDLKRKGFTGAEVVGKNTSGSFRIASKGYATNEEAIKDLTEIRQTVNSSAWIFEKK